MSDVWSCESVSTELAKAKLDTAILVFGGTEQIGPCLPCCIDSLVASYLASQYAKTLNAYHSPCFPYNTSQEHGNTAGTLSLSAAIMHSVCESLILQLSAQGFSRFVILSPHGGSHWEAATIKELNAAYPKISVISAKDGAGPSFSQALQAADIAPSKSLHGGLIPLYTVAYLRPDLIREGRFGTLHSEQSEEAFNYGLLSAYSEDGCWGEPVDVKIEEIPEYAEKGRLFWTSFAQLQAQRLSATLDRVAELRSQISQKT